VRRPAMQRDARWPPRWRSSSRSELAIPQRKRASGAVRRRPMAVGRRRIARARELTFVSCAPAPEVCDGLDNNCDGLVDEELPDCDPCAHPHHDLPVVTHWSNAAHGFVYLASDQANLGEPYPLGEPYVAGSCYPALQYDLPPNYDRYVGDTWSMRAVTDAEATGIS